MRAGHGTRQYKVVKSSGPNDLVFQSVREGRPLRDNNILVRFLKPAGRKEHLQQLTVDWVERGAGAECIAQLDSAQQIIAEVVPRLRHSASAKHLSSWVGACPGEDESARVSDSHRFPKGNRHMRRILDQCAKAAAKSKGTIFQIVYGRLVSRLGHNQTIGAIAHRLCRLIWIILHQAVRYEERGPAVNAKSRRKRTNRMIRELRSLGYRVEALGTPA